MVRWIFFRLTETNDTDPLCELSCTLASFISRSFSSAAFFGVFFLRQKQARMMQRRIEAATEMQRPMNMSSLSPGIGESLDSSLGTSSELPPVVRALSEALAAASKLMPPSFPL